MKGQENGQDESTEEEGHEQHEEHTLAGGEVKLQGWDGVSAGLRPIQQAAIQCSPPEPSIPSPSPLPGGLSDPTDPLYLSPARDRSSGAPPNLPVHRPHANLGLEAEDGDREADEGRDAQAQQHRGGVVVTAGAQPRGQFPAGLLVSRPSLQAHPLLPRPNPMPSCPTLSPFPGSSLSLLPWPLSWALTSPTCYPQSLVRRILERWELVGRVVLLPGGGNFCNLKSGVFLAAA